MHLRPNEPGGRPEGRIAWAALSGDGSCPGAAVSGPGHCPRRVRSLGCRAIRPGPACWVPERAPSWDNPGHLAVVPSAPGAELPDFWAFTAVSRVLNASCAVAVQPADPCAPVAGSGRQGRAASAHSLWPRADLTFPALLPAVGGQWQHARVLPRELRLATVHFP